MQKWAHIHRGVGTLVALGVLLLTLGRLWFQMLPNHHAPMLTHRLVGMRVCVIVDDDSDDSGSGQADRRALVSATAALLNVLVNARRAEVTVLHLGHGTNERPAELVDVAGVRWKSLPLTEHKYDASPAVAISFRVLEWLRLQRPFEHVVFATACGAAYYSLIAREQALALHESHVSLMMGTPLQMQWRKRRARARGGASIAELEVDHMQRAALAQADALAAPASALRFMHEHGWRLPPLSAPLPSTLMAEVNLEADSEAGADADADVEVGMAATSEAATPREATQPAVKATSSAGKVPLVSLWTRLQGRPAARASRRQASAGRQTASGAEDTGVAEAGDTGVAEAVMGVRAGTEIPAGMELPANSASSQPLATSAMRTAGSPPTVQLPASTGGGAASPLVSVCIVHHERGPLLLQASMHT